MTSFAGLGRIVVIVPTFNERENIARLLDALEGLYPGISAVVADDGSMDGTREIVSRKHGENARIARGATVRQATGTSRLAILSVAVLFVAGLVLLLRVNEAEARARRDELRGDGATSPTRRGS